MDVIVKEKKVKNNFKRNQKIGFGAFLAITASMVLEIYEYPLFAASGYSLILFLLIAGACFFLPIAIAAAEMGTVKKWDKKGIFIWVSKNLGKRWGFYAVFFQWLAMCDAMLAMLYYVVSGLGFVFGGVHGFNLLTLGGTEYNNNSNMIQSFTLTPITDHSVFDWSQKNKVINEINNMQNSYYSNQNFPLIAGSIFGIAILIFIFISVIQLFGVKYAGRIAKIGFWGGVALPTLIIVILGSMYVAQGHKIYETGSSDDGSIFTRGESAELALISFVAVVLSFIGPEASGNLANKLNNVNKYYPLAIFILMTMSISFSSIASIFIAISQNGDINQTGGISIALVNFMLLTTNISVQGSLIFARVIVFMMCLGIIAELGSWIIGLSMGLKVGSDYHVLPEIFGKVSKRGVPVFNLFIQTIIVIILEATVTLGLGLFGGSAFNAGISITVIIYIFSYWLMWIAHIKMLVQNPNITRYFKIKNRKLSIAISVIGILCAAFAWSSSWINNSGVPNSIFYGVIGGISLSFIIFSEIMYNSYKIYRDNRLLIQYKFNYSYFDKKVSLKQAKKMFLNKLNKIIEIKDTQNK